MKRIMDLLIASTGLIFFSPFLLIICYLVWRQDKHSPFYVAPRVGKNEIIFSMVKLRSMIKNADQTGVDSTGANDNRITPIGHFIRRYKLDEIMQLWNVLIGEMSLVGPRPNVKREVNLYTQEEKKLLTIRPGITSFASIVFSDEGDILKNKPDPDIAYNQLIRPWKSRLDLVYIQKRTFLVDIKLIWLTIIAIVNREKALTAIVSQLQKWQVSPELAQVASRQVLLQPYPPPGAREIVTSRAIYENN